MIDNDIIKKKKKGINKNKNIGKKDKLFFFFLQTIIPTHLI